MSIFIIKPDDEAQTKKVDSDSIRGDFEALVALAKPLYDDMPASDFTDALDVFASNNAFDSGNVNKRIKSLAVQAQLLAIMFEYILVTVERLVNGDEDD